MNQVVRMKAALFLAKMGLPRTTLLLSKCQEPTTSI